MESYDVDGQVVCPGDWVVGTEGELTSYNSVDFHRTYELYTPPVEHVKLND